MSIKQWVILNPSNLFCMVIRFKERVGKTPTLISLTFSSHNVYEVVVWCLNWKNIFIFLDKCWLKKTWKFKSRSIYLPTNFSFLLFHHQNILNRVITKRESERIFDSLRLFRTFFVHSWKQSLHATLSARVYVRKKAEWERENCVKSFSSELSRAVSHSCVDFRW